MHGYARGRHRVKCTILYNVRIFYVDLGRDAATARGGHAYDILMSNLYTIIYQ